MYSRKKLGRRLLFEKCGSDEHERSILSRLKQQFGGQFTSKMEGMITDFAGTRDGQEKFEFHISAYPELHPGLELNVTVLTTGYWPTYKTADINLPKEMVNIIFYWFYCPLLSSLLQLLTHGYFQVCCVEAYRNFYQENFRSRRLNWIYSLGSCIILGKFEAKNTEIVVTTYQVRV